jgi:hypothetical protein
MFFKWEESILHEDFTPMNMNPIPIVIKNNLAKEIFSTIPHNPIVVVSIKIIGPMSANELFITNALSIELNFNISKAALISIQPEINLKITIPNTAFSIIENIAILLKNTLLKMYMKHYINEGQVFLK